MSKNVFVSYPPEEQGQAPKICDLLERRGLCCRIAPRDVSPDGPRFLVNTAWPALVKK